MSHRVCFISLVILLLPLAVIAQTDSTKQAEPEVVVNNSDSSIEVATPQDRYVITYYHGNRRCATCQKLEAYSTEAVENGFVEELKNGKVVWQTLNYDEEANEHVKKDYGIFSQTVIVSHIIDNKEVEWTNLNKIWDLVGDKDKYLQYIQTESKNFMTLKTKE